MKSNLSEDKYYIECCCRDSDHLLCFDIITTKEKNKEIDINIAAQFVSSYKASLFHRIKHALSFIFGGNNLCYGDGILIDDKNIEQFEEVICKIKQLRNTVDKDRKVKITEDLSEIFGEGSNLDLDKEFQFDTIRKLIRRVKESKKEKDERVQVTYGEGTKVKVKI